ncbi:Cysteine oxygenase/2-aminoethanethiol dioxygenase [Dillenia turbinata]|uniref:cysteine dioxygenase n=1 Tax=Dillenia turbinata TaxID=194707 RepID=A0AAN8ZGH5_9MAGN
MDSASRIQVLYDACDAVFSQMELPNFQQIQWLRKILDSIEAIDVGIDEFSTLQSPSSSPEDSKRLMCGQNVSNITYIHIHQCDNFSIGVFCFPAGGVLPLHDHPRMTVLSKLLYGSVYVKAYDWVKMETNNSRTIGLAGKVMDGIMSAPSEPTVLFPRSGGNIHSFTALSPCAILDVLSPPYSEELGRPSTYYWDTPIPSLPGYAILEERDLPEDLVVKGAPYLGPPIAIAMEIC